MLGTLDRILWRLVDGCLFLIIVSLVACIIVEIITRMLGVSVPWTVELSRFLFIWAAFLGMTFGFRSNEHPSIEFLADWLPPVLQRCITLFIGVCVTVFFLVIAYYSILLVLQQLSNGQESPSLGVAMWVVTLPVALGSILSIIGVVSSTLGSFTQNSSEIKTFE